MKHLRKTKKLYLFFFVLLVSVTNVSFVQANSNSNFRVSIVGDPCFDGIDNDRDGFTDFPNDLDCEDYTGQSEGIPVEPPPPIAEEEPRRLGGGNSNSVYQDPAYIEEQRQHILDSIFTITIGISELVGELVESSTGHDIDEQPFRGRTIVTQDDTDLFDVRIDPIITESIDDKLNNDTEVQLLLTSFYLLLAGTVLNVLRRIIMMIP